MNSCRGVCSRLASAAAGLAAVLASHVASASPLVPDDLVRLRTITELAVSPTGSHVVCVVDGAVSVDAGKWTDTSQLVLVDLIRETRPALPLTSGVRRDCGPAFSPNGERIAFLRDIDGEGLQVHVQSIAGGEPQRLSFVPGGVLPDDGVEWSPEGRLLAVTGQASTPRRVPPGSTALQQRLAAHVVEGDPRIERSEDAGGFVDGDAPTTVLYLIDVQDPLAPAKRLPGRSVRQANFGVDGDTLLCTARLQDDTAPGQPDRSVIARLDLSGDAEPEIVLSKEGWDLLEPQISRDGQAVAVRGRARNGTLEPDRLGVAALSTPTPRLHWWTGDDAMDHAVLDFHWEVASNHLLLTAPSDGGITLFTFSDRYPNMEPRVLVESTFDLPIGVGSFGSGGGVVAYVRTSVDAPSELWLVDRSSNRRRWDPNPWLADRTLFLPDAGFTTPADEPPVPWWLFMPEDVEDDVSLIVLFPPGPGSMWGPGVLECWFRTQWLTGQGWAVLYANPRGSAGEGRAERRRAFRDPVRGPSRDMLWSIESVQQTNPGVGRTQRAMIASSTGTLAGAWTAAADSFDGIVFEDGVFNVPIGFARAASWSMLMDLFGGPPQDSVARRAMLESDLSQHINRIDAPTLLVTMGGDPVSEVDSDLFYRMLVLSNKPAVRIRYSAEAGGPTIMQRRDLANRIMVFLRERLNTPSQAP